MVNKLLGLGVVVALVMSVVSFMKPAVTPPSGAISGPSIDSMLEVYGGMLYGKTYATSTTATTQTLAARDFATTDGGLFNVVRFTPNVGPITLTLPASSTMAYILPRAGQSAPLQCWLNATGTAAANITFAGGTGTALNVASSSASALGSKVIGPGEVGCFSIIRNGTGANAQDFSFQFLSFI